MTQRVVVIGAGGFGREILDVLDAINNVVQRQPQFEIIGVVDANPSRHSLDQLRVRGVPYLGTDERWLEQPDSALYVVGVGDPKVRMEIDRRYAAAGHKRCPALIHPRAHLGSSERPAAGSVICAGVQVSTNVTIGQNVHINPNATIGHDVVLADNVSVNPGVILSGAVVMEEGSLAGAGAVVLENLRVGSHSTIGAGSCVVRSVPPNSVVKGVPAR